MRQGLRRYARRALARSLQRARGPHASGQLKRTPVRCHKVAMGQGTGSIIGPRRARAHLSHKYLSNLLPVDGRVGTFLTPTNSAKSTGLVAALTLQKNCQSTPKGRPRSAGPRSPSWTPVCSCAAPPACSEGRACAARVSFRTAWHRRPLSRSDGNLDFGFLRFEGALE